MNKNFLLVCLMAVLSAAPARAESVKVINFPNGLRWIHQGVKHNSIVALRLFFPGGASIEPAERAGVTSLMTSVMFKGTENRSALQIAQETELLGASFGATSEDDFWDMSLQTTTDKFAAALDIFTDVLFHPIFPQKEFEKEKAAHLNGLRSRRESIFNVAYDLMQKQLFGDHPYGRPGEGTEDSVSGLTREGLARWHKDHLMPTGAVLVTVGNIPHAKLKERLEKTFGSWEAPAILFVEPVPDVIYPSRPLPVAEKHPFEQSYGMMAYPAPSVVESDYPLLKVLNAHLGAGMSSPLFMKVREEEGLAYEVSSFYPTRRLGSAYVVYAGTDPKNLEKAMGKIGVLIDELLARGLPPESLKEAQQYIRGRHRMDHQTNGRIAWYLGWWEMLGKGHAYDQKYLEEISAVTPADVNRVAKAIFRQFPVVVKIISNK